MALKRRKFVRSLLVAPAAASLLPAQETKPTPQPPPQPNTPARQVPRQPTNVPKLKVQPADVTSDPMLKFFSETQFATLKKLGDVLVPPYKEHPGAADAKAAEFLDFLVSVSPADRQQMYRKGLDALNVQAKKQFKKEFASLEPAQCDSILRPLLVARPWPQDFPEEPEKKFVAQVHEDLRTATMNSREWASSSKGFTFRRAVGFYWHPIDPVVES